jgi:hypothetical protein
MEEKLDAILANQQELKNKLEQCYELLRKINKDTEDSFENDAKEIAYNIIGDMIGNIVIPERVN